MVKGYALIITPIFNFKDFYLVYIFLLQMVSNFRYRWSSESMDNGLTYYLYELKINITVFLAI